jgi:hypothetical protein
VKTILTQSLPINISDEDSENSYYKLIDSVSIRLFNINELDIISPIRIQAIINQCYNDEWRYPINDIAAKNIELMKHHITLEMNKRKVALKNIIILKRALNKNNHRLIKKYLKYSYEDAPTSIDLLVKCLNMMDIKQMDIQSNGENYNVITGEYEYNVKFQDGFLWIEYHHDGYNEDDESDLIWKFDYDDNGIYLVDFIWAG